MSRLSPILSLILLLLVPVDAAALWLDGQCSAALDQGIWSDAADAVAETDEAEGCDGDSTDPSSNACFEAAEHPISTLPELIAQTHGEQLGAQMADVVDAMVAMAAREPTASPEDASLEDPVVPGVPLAKRSPMPLPTTPSSCTAANAPDQCHSAPTIPHLNLETSASPADTRDFHADLPPPLDDLEQAGLSNEGLADATGVHDRVERPPEIA